MAACGDYALPGAAEEHKYTWRVSSPCISRRLLFAVGVDYTSVKCGDICSVRCQKLSRNALEKKKKPKRRRYGLPLRRLETLSLAKCRAFGQTFKKVK